MLAPYAGGFPQMLLHAAATGRVGYLSPRSSPAPAISCTGDSATSRHSYEHCWHHATCPGVLVVILCCCVITVVECTRNVTPKLVLSM